MSALAAKADSLPNNAEGRLRADAVEKGKNEPTGLFICAAVETGFRNPTHHSELTKAAD
jgi:hypothetical protein